MDPTHVNVITAESFRDLVQTVGPELRGYCLRFVAYDQTLADEVVQVTFMTVWRERHRFEGGNARAWIFAIARRVALYALRQENRWQSLPPLYVLQQISSQALQPIGNDERLLELARRCTDRLKPIEKTILEGVLGLGCSLTGDDPDRGFTYEEVQLLVLRDHEVDLKVNYVRVLFQRAVANVDACIKKALAQAERLELRQRAAARKVWLRQLKRRLVGG